MSGANEHLRSIANVERTYRVVVAKAGLDGHDRGVKVIARALRDAGFEVIYTGLFSTPDEIAEVVLQEDADAVGLSVLSGAHEPLFAQLVSGLHERGLDDVLVFGGGIIPDDDVVRLEAMGVANVFTPGSSMTVITDWLTDELDRRAGRPVVPTAPGRAADR
ncbi:MAG: cobalamin B12-binding domain-containing protein [Actinobacteria bacterium]|nr:cobalamin B12-binding domain-containing protein [Actinomycetota bacterium]